MNASLVHLLDEVFHLIALPPWDIFHLPSNVLEH
jgi:hypothetical protein